MFTRTISCLCVALTACGGKAKSADPPAPDTRPLFEKGEALAAFRAMQQGVVTLP